MKNEYDAGVYSLCGQELVYEDRYFIMLKLNLLFMHIFEIEDNEL